MEHLVPLADRQHRALRKSPHFLFAMHARQGVFVPFGVMERAKQDVPDGEKRGEVLIKMLAHPTVVNTMTLWTIEQNCERTQMKSDVGMNEHNPSRKQRTGDSALLGIQLEQNCHGYGG